MLEKKSSNYDDMTDFSDSNSITYDMKKQRNTLINEAKEEDNKKTCFSTVKLILQYLRAEKEKKPSSHRIGVFTVFIVVMVITMLKSVIDSSPILFVKIGQEQVGAIDITIMAPSETTSEIPGNMNFYDINPFENPFAIERSPQKVPSLYFEDVEHPEQFYENSKVTYDHFYE